MKHGRIRDREPVRMTDKQAVAEILQASKVKRAPAENEQFETIKVLKKEGMVQL